MCTYISASMCNKLPSYIVNSSSYAHYFLTDHLYVFYGLVYLFNFLMLLQGRY